MSLDRKRHSSSNKMAIQVISRTHTHGLQFQDRLSARQNTKIFKQNQYKDDTPIYSLLSTKNYYMGETPKTLKTDRKHITSEKKFQADNTANTFREVSQNEHPAHINPYTQNQYFYKANPRVIQDKKKSKFIKKRENINNMLKSVNVQKVEMTPKKKSNPITLMSRTTQVIPKKDLIESQKISLTDIKGSRKKQEIRPPRLKSNIGWRNKPFIHLPIQIVSPGPSPWKIQASPVVF